jgi:Lecithin retinol acyltransferase
MNWRTDNARDSLLRPGEEPALASHLVTPRAFHTHHDIYAGNGRVIHYSGLAYGWRRGAVEDVSLDRFAHGRSIRVRRDFQRFDPGAVVERACSRLGERSYRILTNNCEHFCAWALRGESYSSQVDWLRALPRKLCAVLRAWIQGSGAIVARQAILMWSETDLSSDGPARG